MKEYQFRKYVYLLFF
jgi:tubulin beta